MPRINHRIPRLYRYLLYGFVLTSWITGISFFILNRWVEVEGEFGPMKHPIQRPTLMLHGASAFLVMITYGVMLASHIGPGWRTGRQRRSGLSVTIAVGVLIVTAYLVYYLSLGTPRDIARYVHLGVGLSLPLLVATHVIRGRLQRGKGRGARGRADSVSQIPEDHMETPAPTDERDQKAAAEVRRGSPQPSG